MSFYPLIENCSKEAFIWLAVSVQIAPRKNEVAEVGLVVAQREAGSTA